jgi:hypothetical protein
MLRGDWAPFERRLSEGLACLARAKAEGSELSAAALEEAATAFRYEHDLIAATDVNAWLERSGLAVDDWMAFLARDLLRQRWHDSLDDTLDRFPPSTLGVMAAALAEGVCSAAFDGFEDAFAARVALVAAAESLTTTSVDTGEVARTARTYAHWFAGLAADEACARLTRAMTIERQYAAAADAVAAHASLQEVVEQHHLQWQQVELDTMQFPTENGAREAVLCVTVDHLSLHDVAALSRRVSERRLWFADELDPEHRDLILSVAPGGVLGPFAVNGHYEVSAVVRRAAPALSDKRVAARARQEAIAEATRRAMRQHISRPRPEVA